MTRRNYMSLNKKNEMFDPEKTKEDFICEHCGSVIPTTYYYENYKGRSYHLECIWDKLIGKRSSNEYEDAREFFFSLQEKVGDWPPRDFDVEEDYLSDLELVKINDRKKV